MVNEMISFIIIIVLYINNFSRRVNPNLHNIDSNFFYNKIHRHVLKYSKNVRKVGRVRKHIYLMSTHNTLNEIKIFIFDTLILHSQFLRFLHFFNLPKSSNFDNRKTRALLRSLALFKECR